MRLLPCLVFTLTGLASATAEPPRFDDPKLTPTLTAATPEALARFEALVNTYRALPAYADHGTVVVVTQVGDRTIRREQPASLTFVRPNKLVISTDLVQVISDGATVTEAAIPLKKYRVTPCPTPFREAILRGGALGSVEFGGMSGLPLAHVLNLVIGHEPARLIADFAPKLVIEPDQELDGTSYQVLRLDEADNHDWRFLIDPKTGLIAHVELAIEGDATRASIAGPTVHVASIRWSAGAIATAPPDPAVFQYHPPDGFKAVAPLDAPPPADK